MKNRRLYKSLLASFLLLFSGIVASDADKPQRIVSLGLCTDQLLLDMVDHTRIAAITPEGKNPFVSYRAANTNDVVIHNATAEDIIRHRPDLIVSTTFGSPDTVRILKHLGYRVEVLPLPRSIAEIYPLLQTLGQWVGEPERAAQIADDLKNRLAAIQQSLAGVPAERAVIYSPNGFVIGSGTLEDDVLRLAGYRNIAAEAGIELFRAISLETLITWQPQRILLENGVNNRDSLAHTYIYHPALRHLVGPGHSVEMPAHLRDCYGPVTADFIAYLAAQRTPIAGGNTSPAL